MGDFVQSAVLDFPLTVEGRRVDLISGAWTTCIETNCPTITAPSNTFAMRLDPGPSETITVRQLNFESATDRTAIVVDGGAAVFEDWGGPSLTMHPLQDSPALDRGSLVDCLASEIGGVDQRGVDRPVGAGCDVGAVEFVESPISDVLFENGFE